MNNIYQELFKQVIVFTGQLAHNKVNVDSQYNNSICIFDLCGLVHLTNLHATLFANPTLLFSNEALCICCNTLVESLATG